MANLKEIRTRITSVESTMQITSAMKMVSAAKFKRAQDAIIQMRPFAKKFNNILLNVSSTVGETEHPMMRDDKGKKVLLIAISSNRGLCGGFNNNVVKEIKKTIEENPENEYSILTIGKKVFDAFKKTELLNSNERLPADAQTIWDDLSYENTISITSKLMSAFENNVFDIVQFDIATSGFTEGRRIADMAYVYNKPLAIHSWGSAISIMAGLHFSLTIPNSAFTEYCFMDHPINKSLFENEKIDISDGYIEPPDTYGLGIKFDESLTNEFPYKDKINTMILTNDEDIGLK